MVTDDQAVVDHPVVGVIRSAARPGEQEQFVLDDRALQLIEYALLRYAEAPSLPEAIQGVVTMAMGFYASGSPTAAGRLITMLAACRPKLPDLLGANPLQGPQVERLLGGPTQVKMAPGVPPPTPRTETDPKPGRRSFDLED